MLSARQRRYLELRAGLRRSSGISRAEAARRTGVRAQHATRFERRALRALRGARRAGWCGDNGDTHGQKAAGAAGRALPPGAGLAVAASTGTASGQRQAVGGVRAHGGHGHKPAPKATPIPQLAAPPFGGIPPSNSSSGPSLLAPLAIVAVLTIGLVALGWSGSLGTAAPTDGPAQRHLPFVAGVGAPALATPIIPPPPPLTAVPRGDPVALVRRAFDALNAADIDVAAALMHPDVTWPTGQGSGTLHGREEFRAYWAEQLADVSIYLEPIDFEFDDDQLVVTTHEVVRRRSADAWYGEYRAERRFAFRDGFIAAMTRGQLNAG